jgi:hypothetical protein
MRSAARSIIWTARLHAAVAAIAAESPPPAAPSVRERAGEALQHCRVGAMLTWPAMDQIGQFRTRLTTGERASHAEFEAAFGEAWDAVPQ